MNGPCTPICLTCAKPIEGGRRKYCSEFCQVRRWRECEHCDNVFLRVGLHKKGGRYCSRECATASRMTYPVRMCEYCHCPFVPHKSNVEGKSNGGRYCSTLCCARSRTLPCPGCGSRAGCAKGCTAKALRSAIHWTTCKECGDTFPARQTNIVYCSEGCVYESNLRFNREKCWRQQFAVEIEWRQCDCGAWFCVPVDPSIRRRRSACSLDCDLRVRVRTRARLKRAARRNGSPYRDVDIFERDGWRCQLACGRKLNPSHKGELHGNAPTIDHIVPLAAGGDDAPWNVQCACRSCNSRKSAGSAGSQLLLRFA